MSFCPPCPGGSHLTPKPPSLCCCCSTRQGRGAETWLVGPWHSSALLQVWRVWPGGWQHGQLGSAGSSSLIYRSWQNGHSRHAGGAGTLINGTGKKEVTAPLPLLPASHQLLISQKIRDNQPCPLAVPSPSPGAGTQCGARADPSPCQAGDPCPCHSLVTGYLHQLHFSSVLPQKHLFACLHWLLLGPNCKVRLWRAIFVSVPCGAVYFLLAL